jgi:hypothetical protein
MLVGAVTSGAVNVTEQLPEYRTHWVDEKVPPPLEAKSTAPVGTMAVPDPVSWTVTVHVVFSRECIQLGLQPMET